MATPNNRLPERCGGETATLAAAGLLVAAVLIAIAGYRTASFDYEQYQLLFDQIADSPEPLLDRIWLGKDPGFGLLVAGVQALGLSDRGMFVATASASILLKAIAFRRLLGQTALPLLIWAFCGYLLFDCIVIRAGLAVGLYMLALSFAHRRRHLAWISLGLAATSMHASAVVLLPYLVSVAVFGHRATTQWIAAATTLIPIGLAKTLIGEVESLLPRAHEYTYGAAINWKVYGVLLGKVVVLAIIQARLRTGTQPAVKRTAIDGLALVRLGTISFVILSIAQPGMAFRTYELFASMSVLVLAPALRSNSVPVRLCAVGYCAVDLLIATRQGFLSTLSLAIGQTT
jgi:hypothetical protein